MHRKNYPKAVTYYNSGVRSFYNQFEIYNDQIGMAKLYLANAQFFQGRYKEAVYEIDEVIVDEHNMLCTERLDIIDHLTNCLRSISCVHVG